MFYSELKESIEPKQSNRKILWAQMRAAGLTGAYEFRRLSAVQMREILATGQAPTDAPRMSAAQSRENSLSPNARKLLAALRGHTEGCAVEDEDGNVWKTVYLDNATVGFDKSSVAGLFSALKVKGFYRVTGDDFSFGEVKI